MVYRSVLQWPPTLDSASQGWLTIVCQIWVGGSTDTWRPDLVSKTRSGTNAGPLQETSRLCFKNIYFCHICHFSCQLTSIFLGQMISSSAASLPELAHTFTPAWALDQLPHNENDICATLSFMVSSLTWFRHCSVYNMINLSSMIQLIRHRIINTTTQQTLISSCLMLLSLQIRSSII